MFLNYVVEVLDETETGRLYAVHIAGLHMINTRERLHLCIDTDEHDTILSVGAIDRLTLDYIPLDPSFHSALIDNVGATCEFIVKAHNDL